MSLHLDTITLTYPDGQTRLTALDNVTLHAESGRFTAVIGPSGSGKSSLLSVAATLVTPDEGQVTVGGTEVTALSRTARTALRRDSIGFVFQQPNLLPALTSCEQLQVMAHMAGHPPRTARARARGLLDTVGLAALADRRPHQLSGGQRQRVNIARALMNEPPVLLVDEPTSALDRARGTEVVDLIDDLTRTRDIATVMVTHNRGHLQHADQVVELVDGTLRTPSVP
ncbi:ABC transporter ATP-binding protein [Haloactinomyces albus]|uniref:ABC transport system ATP-binding protein n=1 Tax=Haloactinomyces albus TaxID=1352928 RepID=A0AAE4CM48_9ACTN|nr:ABC transporter ATP-binding protein [Haloactinomyces albus]MDR7302950.1 putative ABC transport system ATP-binding protein [Haloactinomyces albus]